MKACGVVRHLFYTSEIQLIVLEQNHLIYKHVYLIYTQRKLLVWLDTYSIPREMTVDSSGTKPFDI